VAADGAPRGKDAALISLCANLSHELNNIFMVVQGNLSLMREVASPSEMGDEMVEEMLAASQRGIDMARKLQAYAGRAPLWPATIDLRQIVENTLLQLQKTVLRDVRVEISLPGEPCLVHLDPRGAGTAFSELAANARAAMTTGGTLVIELSKTFQGTMPAHGLGAPNFALLRISDDGVGMSRDTMARATEPMFSLKHGSNARIGWGLSVAAGFVRQSHGRMILDRAPIGGTQVAMYLPLRDEYGDLARLRGE
jgi:signal transduction histidine kinase